MKQGERVREIRRSCGLTLEKFGEKIGLKKNSVSQIETGKNDLTEGNIKAICREFNVNESYLREEKGKMFKEIPEEDEIADIVSGLLEDGRNNPFYEIILEIILTYRELSPKSQAVLMDTSAILLENLRKKKED